MTRAQITFAANQGDIGGGEVMLLNLATAARDLGVVVDVVAPSGSAVLREAEDSGFAAHGLGATRRDYLIRLNRWQGRGNLLWANGLAPAFATSGQRDRVVHLHQRPHGKQWHAARAARARSLVTVVPSHDMADAIPHARVLHNWTKEITPVTQRPGDHPVVGFIGRPSVDKGVVVLADAIHLLAQRMPAPPRLLLAGEPRFVEADEQRQVEAALGRIDHLVDRAGWVDPHDFFAQVDLAVFPSVWEEPFGLVVAEAMSAGVPFVISDAGALPEVAGPDHPWVARSGDADHLAVTIAEALAAAEPTRQLNLATARRRWEEQFSPAAGRERMRPLLTELKVLG